MPYGSQSMFTPNAFGFENLHLLALIKLNSLGDEKGGFPVAGSRIWSRGYVPELV